MKERRKKKMYTRASTFTDLYYSAAHAAAHSHCCRALYWRTLADGQLSSVGLQSHT